MEKEYYERMKKQDPNYLKKKYKKQKANLNSNPLTFASNKYSKQKSKALITRGIPWRLDREKTVQQIAQSKTCNLTGRPLVFEIGHPDSPSIDRIDSCKGYTKSNIQIVGSRVNQSKNNMSDEEFIQMCMDVVKHHGYRIRAK